jgi:hypothetical protein
VSYQSWLSVVLILFYFYVIFPFSYILEFIISYISYRGFFHAEMSTYSYTLPCYFPFVKHHLILQNTVVRKDEFSGFQSTSTGRSHYPWNDKHSNLGICLQYWPVYHTWNHLNVTFALRIQLIIHMN